jgi:hypothetical protein
VGGVELNLVNPVQRDVIQIEGGDYAILREYLYFTVK